MSTRNITKAYRLASDDDRQAGEMWYAHAYAFCESLDSDVSRAAGVVAALSPMLSWPRNMVMAEAVYAGERRGCLSSNIAKAVRILDGEAPLDVLRGTKVRSFYANIMGDGDAVTVDRHAMMVADNTVYASDDLDFSATNVRRIADEYRRAARILSRETGRTLTPAMVQATVWVWWRKHHAPANHG
jgi:hypothetical protein